MNPFAHTIPTLARTSKRLRHRRPAPRREAEGWRRRGYSIIEVLWTLALLGILAALAGASMLASRDRARVAAARGAFSATHSLARQVAARYGRASKLWIDSRAGSFWLTVDTTAAPWGGGIEDTVREVVNVGDRFGGVRISSTRRLLCFDPSGLATAIGECELLNATIVLWRGRVADTITIFRLGRLRDR